MLTEPLISFQGTVVQLCKGTWGPSVVAATLWYTRFGLLALLVLQLLFGLGLPCSLVSGPASSLIRPALPELAGEG